MDIIISAIAGALGNLASDAAKAGYAKLKELVLRKLVMVIYGNYLPLLHTS